MPFRVADGCVAEYSAGVAAELGECCVHSDGVRDLAQPIVDLAAHEGVEEIVLAAEI